MAKVNISNFISTGECNAISMQELCKLLSCGTTCIKNLIREERKQGVKICSSHKGYYLPADDLELLEYVNRTQSDAEGRYNLVNNFINGGTVSPCKKRGRL